MREGEKAGTVHYCLHYLFSSAPLIPSLERGAAVSPSDALLLLGFPRSHFWGMLISARSESKKERVSLSISCDNPHALFNLPASPDPIICRKRG